MTIDGDVHILAKEWGLDETLVQAVVQAEGDIVKAVQCSIPSVTTRSQALDILCRSLTHRMNDYIAEHHRVEWVAFFGARWAPVGVSNDPTRLNDNFVSNVIALWHPPTAGSDTTIA